MISLITKFNNESNKFSNQNNKNLARIELISAYNTTYTEKKLVKILSREAVMPK